MFVLKSYKVLIAILTSTGRIIPGSPSDRSGQLNIDDRILEINGVSVLDLPHSDVVGLVKNSGTTVKLKIARPGWHIGLQVLLFQYLVVLFVTFFVTSHVSSLF